MKMREKIALVTAGGHVPCFHASMRAMHGALENYGADERFELVGAKGGVEGLLKEKIVPIKYDEVEPFRAGSLIGADRNNPTEEEMMRIPEIMGRNGIYALIMMGGDNHLGVASRIHKSTGARIIGWPKTMDGDLSSGVSLGYTTAVCVGAERTKEHHASALTYGRVFYVGLFGRNTDWVSCGVGAFGGADLVIPCEAEYPWEKVFEKINLARSINKEKYGLEFAVVPYAEGARIGGIKEPPEEHRSYDKHGLPKLHPEWIGMELVRLTKRHKVDAAFQAHTYDMRDSPPVEMDLALSRAAGFECIKMILEGDFGKSVVFNRNEISYRPARKPLDEVAVQAKLSGTGYFDYSNLKPDKSFVRDFGRLFVRSIGHPPLKDNLVYKNMVGRN